MPGRNDGSDRTVSEAMARPREITGNHLKLLVEAEEIDSPEKKKEFGPDLLRTVQASTGKIPSRPKGLKASQSSQYQSIILAVICNGQYLASRVESHGWHMPSTMDTEESEEAVIERLR
jgi:hypothetical protein